MRLRSRAGRRLSAATAVLAGLLLGLATDTFAADPVNAANAATTADSMWKLTVGDYLYPEYSGVDVNLRWRRQDTDAWIGLYRDRVFGRQTRVGIDTSIDLVPLIQLQPSLQLATAGFIGGSLNVQAGDAWYGFAGLGRTNLKPYFNLNFDPNDAVTLGAGHRSAGGSVFSLFVVADDRLHTRQRDWHVNARVPVDDLRVTLDILRKSGLSDVGPITAWGFSITGDWPVWFVRLARDPKQNFSAQDAWRIAGGMRF